MQPIIRGKDLDLYFLIDGVPCLAAHAQDCTLKLSADITEVTTKDGRKGKSFDYQGKYSYVMELKGLSQFYDQANLYTFQEAVLLSTKLLFAFTNAQQVLYSGTLLMPEVDMDSPVEGVSVFSTSMQGDGELLITLSSGGDIPLPNTVDIIDQFGNIIAVVPAPGAYNVLVFNRIEQGHADAPAPDLIIMQAQ
jgi:predicted secreted protein